MSLETENREPPTCSKKEKQLCGPIAWKLLNKINYLIFSDTEKDDFHDVMIHPNGYLCFRKATQDTIFGFEFRIPIKEIQLPAQLTTNKEQNSASIFMNTKDCKNIVQVMQFVDEEKEGTDLGYSSGLTDGVGIQMTDSKKAHEVHRLMNILLDHLVNTPTLTYAALPSFWGK